MKLTFSADLSGHSPESVFAWHERPGAFERLTPPWTKVRVLESNGGIGEGGRRVLRVKYGPSAYRWELRHTGYRRGERFVDEQVSGPMRRWRHEHLFEPTEDGGTRIVDRLDIELPAGAGAGFAPNLVKRELGRFFAFRYRRLQADLDRHAEHGGAPGLRVGVSGASGLVGSALCAFLETGGHDVLRFTRRHGEAAGSSGGSRAYWNPAAGEMDEKALRGLDAVVHLAGAPIAQGRWTPDRRRAIRLSRTRGTALMSRALARSSSGPRTLVSASAVGYYGNRGDQRLDESAKSGRGFLADVCREWEGATEAAAKAGIRVAKMRIGPVLSPAGGALGQMLLPFKFGVGGRIAAGRQYFSWIDADDLTAAIHHVLRDGRLGGAVNATAPNPVPNAAFTSALGRALGRPTLVPVPSLAIKAAFGQLGTEVLLWGQRAIPAKLIDSGFRFEFEGAEDSLAHQLGRT